MSKIVNGLKENFKLKILRCQWHSYLLEAEAENLLQRNQNFSHSALAEEQWVSPNAALEAEADNLLQHNQNFSHTALAEEQWVSPNAASPNTASPNTAKLFICGDAGVGKSTIRKGLTRNPLILKLQSHARRPTIGMDLTSIQFGNQQLQICDLAGQKEYHAFHHLFLTGSDKDLFLVVCKAPTCYDYPEFQSALDYWLRFIASHRSPSSLAKPKVFFVVNYFPDSKPWPRNMNKDSRDLVHNYLQVYSKFLDFGDPEHTAFGLVALHTSQLKPLKLELQQALSNLLEQRPLIPQVCGQIVSELKKAFNGPKHYPKVISFLELCSLLDTLILKHDISGELLRDAIEHLFDMGELIYFKDANEFIILDVQWFVREVIAVVIQPKSSIKRRDRLELLEVRRSLMEVCEETYLDAIINCLENLGVLYKFQEENQPISVLVPALLENPLPGWPKSDLDFFYIGRRYDCTEKKHMLLPSGIFTVLQVQLKELYPNPYHVGDGWISFTTKGIGVTFIIQIGGEKGHWTDRHWIDIMLRVACDNKENPEVTREFFKVRNKIFSICATSTGVSLDEFVIRPESIHELNVLVEYDVALLSVVKNEAQRGGLSCCHIWNAPELDLVSRTVVSELLFIQEWEEHVEQHMGKLMEYMESEIGNLARGQMVKLEKVEVVQSVQAQLCKAHSFSGIDSSSSMHGKLNMILLKQNEMEAKFLKGHKEIMERLDGLQNLVKERADEMLLKLSLLMEISATTLPCLPYFTDESNSIQKLTSGFFGKTFRLHLLCEAKMGGGHHMIPDQKGISVTVSADWMVKFSHILAPAVTIIALMARAGTVIASFYVPGVCTDVLKIFTETTGIGDIVKSMLMIDSRSPCDLLGKARSDSELRSFFKSLQTEELDMKSAFGLHHVMFKGKAAWVCLNHARFGQPLCTEPHF